MEIKIGSIVKHPYRKTTIYRITEIRGQEAAMRRVNKRQGYPDGGDKTTYNLRKEDVEKLEVIDFAPDLNAGVVRPPRMQVPGSVEIASLFIGQAVMQVFSELTASLSPENLSCDGEISHTEMMQKKNKIENLWKALEQFCGFTITEDFVWKWELAQQK